MAIATEFIVNQSEIAALFLAGVRRAETTGRATLVSYSQRVPEADPLGFFAERQRAGVSAFYWERPAESFGLAGSGTAYSVAAQGVDRFEQVQSDWQNLMAQAIIGGVAEWGVGPILMGGFAFDPTHPTTALWQGYEDARLVLPRLQLARKHGQAYLTVNALLEPGNDAEMLAQQVAHLYRQPVSLVSVAETKALQLTDVMPAQEWKAIVGEAVAQVRQGAFQKVVLAREVRAIAEKPFEAGAILERLRASFPDATVFAVAREGRAFVGATPERLVQLRGGEVLTTALAGTTGRGATAEEDAQLGQALLDSAKNMGEHLVVAEIIYEALQKVCVELYRAAPPRLLKLRNLQHLYTPIIGKLRDKGTILQLVEALHPTPALGGFPRAESLAFIRRHENLDRGWYGAPLGWLDRQGEGEFVVAIRSALLDGRQATLFAGCGIVADSEPESEYKESCIKLRAMLSALEG